MGGFEEGVRVGNGRLHRTCLRFFRDGKRLGLSDFSLVPRGSPSLLLVKTNVTPLGPFFANGLMPPYRHVAADRGYVHANSLRGMNHATHRRAFFRVLNGFSFNSCFGGRTVR